MHQQNWALALPLLLLPSVARVFVLLFRWLGAEAAYLLQIPFTHWWMKCFKYGPAEWLGLSLTYLKPQPMSKVNTTK